MTSRQPGTTAPGTARNIGTPGAGTRAAPGPSWTLVLPLTLLILLGLAGLRGTVTAPHWNGPLRHDGVVVGLALEVIIGILLVVTVRRRSAAANTAMGGTPPNDVAAKLRGVLILVLGAGMVAVAVAILIGLHLHAFSKPAPVTIPTPPKRHVGKPELNPPAHAVSFHVSLSAILYGLLVVALVAATAVAGYAVAGWAGLAVVAVAAAAAAMVLLRGLLPQLTPDVAKTAREKPRARPLSGYSHRRFIVHTAMTSRNYYDAELRPVLEHLLAARLAERHGVHLYQDPAAARLLLCRNPRDADLWQWIDPGPGTTRPQTTVRDGPDRRGIPQRTLARLIDRLEKL